METIRIIEFPACKMVSSGYAKEAENPFGPAGQLTKFNNWWSALDKQRQDKWFMRDFMMYERSNNSLIWFYALPDQLQVETDYEIIDFPGGLYAAATAILDDVADEQAVYGAIKQWVAESDNFELNEYEGHYDLSHSLTSSELQDQLGYAQLEIYVPIKLKK